MSHIDWADENSYAIRQQNNGVVRVNAASGRQVEFAVDNTRIGEIQVGTGVTTAELIVGEDENKHSVFGNARVGYCGHNDGASFAHYDNNTTANYALFHSSNRTTYLNCATSRNLHIRRNNVDIAKFNGAGGVGINSAVAVGGDLAVSGLIASSGPELVAACVYGGTGTSFVRQRGFSSVSRASTGKYTFTLSTAAASSDYVISAIVVESNTHRDSVDVQIITGEQTTTTFGIQVHEGDNSAAANTPRDREIHIPVIGI
jgi:hypothetical protein